MASDWKGIVKNGWHPEKAGTTLKGQVKGLIGRNDKPPAARENYTPRPIKELRDPATFAPPPKRDASISPRPPTRRVEEEVAEVERPPARSTPYRVDTTGLNTSRLPPPPTRHDSPSTGTTTGTGSRPRPPPPPYTSKKPTAAGPPSLPPRLPPRKATDSSPAVVQPPTDTVQALTGQPNQSAVSRLGAAGISVPAFGIGGKTSPANSSPPAPGRASSQISDLGSRFSRLSTKPAATSDPAAPVAVPGRGTTFAEKQAAIRTAAAFHKDPRSVSLSDARAAAGTANNFRQRHGDQVASGLKSASDLNQRYGIADRVQAVTGPPSSGGKENGASRSGLGAGLGAAAGMLAKKKPAAPPPPPKRAGPAGPEHVPPPVPMATRPKF